MAETKSSTSPSLHSKGGPGDFAKQVQRKLSRAQEKVLQKFGKSEETRDAEFEVCVQNLQEQQNDGHRIYKDCKAFLNAVTVMRDASSRLFQSLYDVYELDWEGGEDLGAVVEGEDLLWNDYEAKLRDQALLTIESYISQFPDMRERVAKRGRKLVDYDSTRHHVESLQNAKKRDEIKIVKAEEELKMTKTIFEDMNRELKEELPLLYDSRVGCYVTVFQAISNLREIFYKEMFQNNKDLQNIIMNLKAQHPDKIFVVKNFSRGTLKRRSLKDALSPRSLRASFSELHMSYSSRGTLRREHTSSFRFEKGPSEVLSSPARPKPPKDSNCGVMDSDGGSFSEDNPDIETTPSSTPAHVVEDTTASESVQSTTKKDVKQENEGTETTKKEPLPGSDYDGERMALDSKGELSPHTVTEKLSTHPDELKDNGSELENGIGTNCKKSIEGSEVSCKEDASNDQILNEIKGETF